MLKEGRKVITADIQDGSDVRCLSPNDLYGVDVVVHLAGISFAPEWTSTDDLIWEHNVNATRHLVQQAERSTAKRFIFASSASVYEGGEGLYPVSAYSKSKLVAERLVFGSAIPQRIVVRKGTLCGFGRKPRFDLVLNAMCMSALQDNKIYVNGTGEAMRPVLRLQRAVHTYNKLATFQPAYMKREEITLELVDANVNVVGLAGFVQAATGAEIIHRPGEDRPRSYTMAEYTSTLGVEDLVREVLYEAKEFIDVDLSEDPRKDRLEELRALHE
tara:strand:- start:1144 stop:1962 length:819 start_codon:yes stop_codon:yes gene_type:complete